MRKNLFLTTAAALVVSAGIATAQSSKGQEGASPPPAAQQYAPAEKSAPAVKPEAKVKPEGKTAPRAESKGSVESETTGQAPNARTKSEMKNGTKASSKTEMKNGSKSERKSEGKGHNKAAETKTNAQSKDNKAAETKTNAKSQTTGQGAASARSAANLSTEQRTKIRTTIKENAHVRPMTNVNFDISVGARVPRTVHFYRVPREVVDIYPQWRGYDFIMVRDEIIVIDPHTYEIVYVIS
jgi:hypothetical protein